LKPRHDTPPALYRISDGEPLSINDDGTYSLDNSMMGDRYRWTYAHLIETGAFTANVAECFKGADE
jgi:hypothetical protein